MCAQNDISPAENGRRFTLSVDVEDYFQVWAFSDVVSRNSWDGFALRVGDNTRRCLDLFDAHDAKATFFTLGWVAERDPDLIKAIVSRGHELASHGYDHTKVTAQTRGEFHADVMKTKKLLEDIGGADVKGYRAAGFSIGRDTPWAHEALAEAGYLYSSSTHPIAHDHYGDASAPQSPYETAGLIEAPVATANLFGRRVSAAGGGWFRAAPYGFSKMLLEKASKTLQGPAIFYFHPWEIDPDQPRLNRAGLKSKVRHYLNLSTMERKLSRLLSDFSWGRIDEALQPGAAS
ncbi:XrtA system polysaccharide deacetylase [Hyphococcus luteus]|uniref:Chitooligosaccharide deacetylase n=1 Tax=Hyphococcus luteus TaxID=2058213 RepID=A0A2S7K947_9PROT|nr:XrtA system polysaccharide deacetylase [Marinicaulis flavus]PQA89008.1 polysaccharide deacetylase family protein [Marinicaulis flavus]